jgi:hypothetical protein
MKRPLRTVGLYRWLLVSLLFHSCLLALPSRFLERIFPTQTPSVETVPTDLTPDFEEMAISVVTMSGEPAAATLEAWEPEDVAEVRPVEAFHAAQPGYGPPEPAGYGDSDSQADTRFFPPIPRLIVPPDLDDLGVSSLSVNIRILVGTDGRPVEIELPESIADPEIRGRLMASAGRFRFEPARKGGLPVQSWISLPLQLEASSAR